MLNDYASCFPIQRMPLVFDMDGSVAVGRWGLNYHLGVEAFSDCFEEGGTAASVVTTSACPLSCVCWYRSRTPDSVTLHLNTFGQAPSKGTSIISVLGWWASLANTPSSRSPLSPLFWPCVQ